MSTRAHEITRWVAERWEALYASAVCSGIAPDRRHLAQGGYHVSIEDNPAGNYSIRRPDDRAGPRDLAAAIDMSMSPADMRLCTARLKRVYDDTDDPRRQYLNAINGWLGGDDAHRYDIWARVISWATDDHKWHVHAEFRRRYVADWAAAKAFVSALAGESAAAYQGALQPGKDIDDMTPAELLAHRIPFTYTATDGKQVTTYVTLGDATTRGWVHDYNLRNVLIPNLGKALAGVAGQVAGMSALLKTLAADNVDKIDAQQLQQLMARIDEAATSAADRVLQHLVDTTATPRPAEEG